MPFKIFALEEDDADSGDEERLVPLPPIGFVFRTLSLARLCFSCMADFHNLLLESTTKRYPHSWTCGTPKCQFVVVLSRILKGKRRQERGGYSVVEAVGHSSLCPMAQCRRDFFSTFSLAVDYIRKEVPFLLDAVQLPTKTPYPKPDKEGGKGWALYSRYVSLQIFLQTLAGTEWRIQQIRLYLDIIAFREELKEKGFTAMRDRWKDALPKRGHPHYHLRDFMCFFLLVLTAGVGDVVVCPSCKMIFDKYPVSPQWVLDVGEERLANILSNMSKQYKNAHALTMISKDLLENFEGQVPMDMETLIKYEQVGPKIAVLTLQTVHGINAGIPVDRHLRRVFGAFGWSSKCTSDEETMHHVQLIIPKEYWPGMNDYLAGLCQMLQIQSQRKAILKEAEGRVSVSLIKKMDVVSNDRKGRWIG